MKKLSFVLFVIVSFFAFVGLTHAALFDGKVVSIVWVEETPIGTFYTNYGNITVGPGVEVLDLVSNVGTLDIGDTFLYVDLTRTGIFISEDFNGFRISDVNNTIADFTAVSINPITNMAGFDSSRITFDANNIWVNFQGLTHYSNTVVSLEVSSGTIISCEGFDSPMNTPFTLVGNKKSRIFPLKMSLSDNDGPINSPPVYESVRSDTFPNPLPANSPMPLGEADEGNLFIFGDGKWELNLPVSNFSASGAYTIRAVTGNFQEYIISPSCEATFVIPKKPGKGKPR